MAAAANRRMMGSTIGSGLAAVFATRGKNISDVSHRRLNRKRITTRDNAHLGSA
jgi:hypothetical protein